ncbi:MAG: MarR family winged helix-turn-helix transcriptional regulator [Gaiellaceae bacterium]
MNELDADDYLDASDLRSALRRFERRSEQISRRHNLTPRQYLLLLMLKASEMRESAATITELVERLALTQSTVTELVQRAEDAELVSREPSTSDGRVVHLSLTARGAQRLEGAFRELGPERELLLRLLHEHR